MVTVHQVEGVSRLALDQLREHRDLGQQRTDVAEDHTGLLAVARNDQHGSAFAGRQTLGVAFEARQKHADSACGPL